MIIQVNGNVIMQKCDVCERTNEVELEQQTLEWLPEFNQYKNLNLPECECGTVEVLNMNLPDDESDLADIIPGDEWLSRHLVKNIKRFVMGESSVVLSTIPRKEVKTIEK